MSTTQNLIDRITVNPSICHGKPIIRNKRYPVETILEYLAGGDTIEDLLKEFNDLDRDDILACLTFASAMIHDKSIKATTNEIHT